MSRAWRRRGSVALAALAIGYLVMMVISGALPEQRQRVAFEAKGVMTQAPESIRRVDLQVKNETLRFERTDSGWHRLGSAPNGDRALPKGTASSLDLAVRFMHTADPVRTFEPQDLQQSSTADFGLESPAIVITLTDDQRPVLHARFGDLNADGFLQYMRVGGRGELFLMSRFVGAQWLAVAAGQVP